MIGIDPGGSAFGVFFFCVDRPAGVIEEGVGRGRMHPVLLPDEIQAGVESGVKGLNTSSPSSGVGMIFSRQMA